MSSNLLHPKNFNAQSHTRNSPSINTLTSKTPSTTIMAHTPTISSAERYFWIGMRILSIFLALGSLIISLLSLKENTGLTYFVFLAIAASFSVSLTHLVTLPGNPHAPSPYQRFLLDTIAWVFFLINAVSVVVYKTATDRRNYGSDYVDLYGLTWDPKTVVSIVFFFGGAVGHLISSVYDLVELRRAGMTGYEEEEVIGLGGKAYMSGGVRS